MEKKGGVGGRNRFNRVTPKVSVLSNGRSLSTFSTRSRGPLTQPNSYTL